MTTAPPPPPSSSSTPKPVTYDDDLVASCRIASAQDVVSKDECVYTFHTPFSTKQGIVINLHTFVGTILPMALPSSSSSKGIFLRVVQHHVPKPPTSTAIVGTVDGTTTEPPLTTQLPTKLGIGIEGGFPSDDADAAYDTITNYSIVVLERTEKDHNDKNDDDNQEEPVRIVSEEPYHHPHDNHTIQKSIESIIHHSGMAIQQDLQVWQLDQEPIPISKYANDQLPFVDNGIMISPDPSTWKCQMTGLSIPDNIWLNLSDGYMGGGRKSWDGSGTGTNGALDHYYHTQQQYPLVVKLGTITADIETADCYSYAPDEDGPVRIPNLAQLLEKRGIHVTSMQKTVKSTVELEVELNATYAFDAITEAGSQLQPVTGPTLQGLKNLGNSCYMNSVVQLLLSGTIPELAHRYGYINTTTTTTTTTPTLSLSTPSSIPLWKHPLLQSIQPTDAPTDILCQTTKLCSALTTGIFSFSPMNQNDTTTVADTDTVALTQLDTLASSGDQQKLFPRMFKHAIGRHHVDFRTGQQQDAAQYLQFLLEQLDRAEQKALATGRLCPAIAPTVTTTAHDDDDANNNNNVDQFFPSSHLFAFQLITRLVCSADQKIKYQTNPAPDTIWSLRVPMDETVANKTSTTIQDETIETLVPDQKRIKKESDDDKTTTAEDIPTIPFQACVDAWAEEMTVEGIRWPHLGQSQQQVHPAQSRTRFVNFPRYLVIQIQRYMLGPDWTPVKLKVNLDIPQEIDLSAYKKSQECDEDLVPPEEEDNNENQTNATNGTTTSLSSNIDEAAVSQLTEMGFSRNACIRALTTVGGDLEAAMNWIFEHSMDADFNDPVEDKSSNRSSNNDSNQDINNDTMMDEGIVLSLVENLGCFTMDQVRAALKEANGAPDRAADWLFSHMDDLDGAIAALQTSSNVDSVSHMNSGTSDSTPMIPKNKNTVPLENGEGKYQMIGMISHIGKHTGSGHYVAHLKRPDLGWIMFNDDKVAVSESPPFPHAYLYLFQRQDTMGHRNVHY